jgi:hypothetical protein
VRLPLAGSAFLYLLIQNFGNSADSNDLSLSPRLSAPLFPSRTPRNPALGFSYFTKLADLPLCINPEALSV